MTSNPRQPDVRRRRALLACLGIALAAGLVGCGSDEEPGREITISHTAEPASLDPAYAYQGDGFEEVGASEPLSVVYTPLLTYRHASGTAGSELIPGLAQNLPEVSEDGRTYTLSLRDVLEYPNGAAVRASDFEHTVKRVLTAGSPAASLLEGIEGVDAYLEADDPTADIAGLAVDDRTGEITIRLSRRDASFANVLAIWPLGLVPRNTRFRDRSEDPPPGVGPYEIVEAVPGERFVLERSDSFATLDIPDIPTGSVDLITVVIEQDVDRQAQDVLENRLDYMRDSPPPEVKSTLLSQGDDRYSEHTAPATHLFLLDAGTPPFDDPRVREAANFALDKPALARAFDGALEPGCSLLPPETPGYDDELAVEECPYGAPTEPPDQAQARRLVEQAGATGTSVVVAGIDEEGTAEATRAYAEMLGRIGLDAESRLLPRDRYLRRIAQGDLPGEAAFATLFQAFPHPLNALSRIVADAPGAAVTQVDGPVDDPTVSSRLAQLNREPDVDAATEEWAALDRDIVSPPQSHVAPFGHPRRTTFVSERVDLDQILFHPVFLNDYSTFALHENER